VLSQLHDRTHRIFNRVFSLNPGRMEGSYQEHVVIAETIIQGDADLARAAGSRHTSITGVGRCSTPRRA